MSTQSAKLVLLGESAVGKSSLVLRFVRDEFSDFRESTIGAAFLTRTCKVDDKTIKFEIWDTAGQERYKSLAPIYYRNAQASLVVYDITSAPEASFEKAKSWIASLRRQADPSLLILLCGNKLDIVEANPEARRVSREMAEKYAAEEGLLFMEASAKTGENVKEVFDTIAKALPPPPTRAGATAGAATGARRDGGVTLGEGSSDKGACAC